MNEIKQALEDLLKQLDMADMFAENENPTESMSTWQVQNQHIRDRANEVMYALNKAIADTRDVQ